MKVKCVAEYPAADHLGELGPNFYAKQRFAVTVGEEYLVLGLLFTRTRPFGIGVWVEFEDDMHQYHHAPLRMFDVVDPPASRYWEIRAIENGNVALLPPALMSREFLMEDFYEGVPEVVEGFHELVQQLAMEFSDPSESTPDS